MFCKSNQFPVFFQHRIDLVFALGSWHLTLVFFGCVSFCSRARGHSSSLVSSMLTYSSKYYLAQAQALSFGGVFVKVLKPRLNHGIHLPPSWISFIHKMNVTCKILSLILKKTLLFEYSHTRLALINICNTCSIYAQVGLLILTLNGTWYNKEQMCRNDSRRAGTGKVVSLKEPWDKCSTLDTHWKTGAVDGVTSECKSSYYKQKGVESHWTEPSVFTIQISS